MLVEKMPIKLFHIFRRYRLHFVSNYFCSLLFRRTFQRIYLGNSKFLIYKFLCCYNYKHMAFPNNLYQSIDLCIYIFLEYILHDLSSRYDKLVLNNLGHSILYRIGMFHLLCKYRWNYILFGKNLIFLINIIFVFSI